MCETEKTDKRQLGRYHALALGWVRLAPGYEPTNQVDRLGSDCLGVLATLG